MAWASRRLREVFSEDADRDRWTQHCSTRYLWSEASVAEKITYVVDEQGDPMAVYDWRQPSGSAPSEPESKPDM